MNSILETNVKFDELSYKVVQNKGDILKNKKGSKFVIIGTIKQEHLNNISKALLNRFVVIYVDEKRITEKNIDLNMIDKIIQNLNFRLKKNLEQDYDDNNINIIPEIEKKINKNIFNLLKTKQINFCIKDFSKYVEKLCLIYQKLNCEIKLEDCDILLELFKGCKKKNIEEVLQRNKTGIENFFEKLFKEYIKAQKETDFYFYDKELEIKLNDALKMILGIILSDLTGTSIFLRGHPGSGKSCAGRFYGSKRSFNFREPIISVSCNSDLSLEALIGTYSYQDSKFEFVKGPLLIAMEKGEPILLDEFNLCHESIFSNLLPIFKAKTYEDIDLKYVPKKVKKNPGFFIIATGNFNKEKGRYKKNNIPRNILFY